MGSQDFRFTLRRILTIAMRSVAIIALLAFVSQAHAEEAAAKTTNDSQDSTDELASMLVNKLVARLFDVQPEDLADNEDLDSSTLGKPANLGLPAISPDGQQPEKPVMIIEEQLDDGHALDIVLGLRGGAKAMKAMKTPMKSPMKAMKAMKAMKKR